MVLVIDIGNTRIKLAVFEQTNLLGVVICEEGLFEKELDYFFKTFKINDVIVASVSHFNLKRLVLPEHVGLVVVDRSLPFPFTNRYTTPTTLGIDRMVLAAGAVLQFPNTNRLVIDAGTCITYDYIDDQNNYLGGAISPGLQMRYEALHHYTAKLPLLTRAYPENSIGNATNEAIHSGVVHGTIHEIEGFVAGFKPKNKNFTIILTGGDADFLAKRLKSTIFANSNFLLESLAHLYQHIQ